MREAPKWFYIVIAVCAFAFTAVFVWDRWNEEEDRHRIDFEPTPASGIEIG